MTPNISKLRPEDQKIPLDVQIPDEFYQTLLEDLLERNYLCDCGERKYIDLYRKQNGAALKKNPAIHWLQMTRLPIHPNDQDNYDLLSRWQGVLTSLHAWGHRLYFLLLRMEGRTRIFLGTASADKNTTSVEAIEQLREAAFGSMPGMGLRTLEERGEIYEEIIEPLQKMQAAGAVTGIPSLKESEQNTLLQTLDQLAFGIRDVYGEEKDYALLVIADPISDGDVSDIISRHRRLASQIHTAVKVSGSESMSRSETEDPLAVQKAAIGTLGTIAGTIAGIKYGQPSNGALIGGQVANLLVSNLGRPVTVQGGNSLNYEFLDKFAEYAETAVQHHIDRLNAGRNYGFWNTGIYVLGTITRDVRTVSGMLRSIYSGEESYYEPIRLHLFRQDSNALSIIRDHFDMPMLLNADVISPMEGFRYEKEQWHLFGRNYQYVSTPMTTRELGIATSLPRRDVPGLRFVKTAVRFANNPSETEAERIVLGNIVDTGVEQNQAYAIDVHALVRHTLVAGKTGSGKSTTCKKILSEILLPQDGSEREIPVLIVEPAKDDYVRWALEMNKSLPPQKQFKIYMPGVTEFEGHPIEPFYLNPFQPAAVPGQKVDLLQHVEAFASLLNAVLPSEEVIPILIEETVFRTIEDRCELLEIDYENGPIDPMPFYPDIDTLLAEVGPVMRSKAYEDRVKQNFEEILRTRFKYLRRGTRGRILNTDCSTDMHELLTQNVVINLSHLSGSKDKALVMSLLLQNLYEYSMSRYEHDEAYRKQAQQNHLLHLTLIEEAHNVLMKPDPSSGSGSPEKASADLFSRMLSEIRAYGQGLMIVDQVPSRLIDDATKNTNYKIVHRLTAPDDQELMAACLALREDQKYIIPALEKGHAILCGDEDDAAAWIKVSDKAGRDQGV